MILGVDVGGTFTDLVAWDGRSLRIVKLPSTPPNFERAVIEGISRAIADTSSARVVHGSTVATNGLLQRAGEPVAFVTTEGFRDMLLIGRQNRPRLYVLRVQRPPPITEEQNWFTVRERISAQGEVVQPLNAAEVDGLIGRIRAQGLRHVAVCLLFSFANAAHERLIADRCEHAGLTVSLSSEVLPEFREYERASTTAINAALRPLVEGYLRALGDGMPPQVQDLRIMQSGGGTLSVQQASKQAAKLVASGPAGGVIGAAYAAQQAGFTDAITYDMGGTSTDVALILDGRPQWTTHSVFDNLPIGLPMFDIHSVGAGGGSVAYLDPGGALRVGPRSAGAIPGPACYDRGGTEPTVTDANLVLGRILPEQFLGGAMHVSVELARGAVEGLANRIGKNAVETALGMVRVAEANMASAIRAITAQRGHDPRKFTLISFGGAGGLHACALAERLEIPRVLVPPYCGVFSALGMVVAPQVADVSRTVVQEAARLDDALLRAGFTQLEAESLREFTDDTAVLERFADVRFRGQSHEVTVRLAKPSLDEVRRAFLEAYERLYGHAPEGRDIEIVTLRLRRSGPMPQVTLPELELATETSADRIIDLIDSGGQTRAALALTREQAATREAIAGPLLVTDPEATTYVPAGWQATASDTGMLILERVDAG